MATSIHDSNFTIGIVKHEPIEFLTLTPKVQPYYGYPYIESDHKKSASAFVIKKEEYVSLPIAAIKLETIDTSQHISNAGVLGNDVKVSLDRYGDKDFFNSLYKSQEPGDEEDVSESGGKISKMLHVHKSNKNFQRREYVHPVKRNYICEICSKHFTTKQSVSIHMKIHTGEKNFKCEICAKRFITNQKLSSHMPVHTGERNYECEICTKRFTAKSSLSSHMKTHSSEKKYKCEICIKCFTTNSSLLTHKKTHASERNHKCDVCTKRFKTKSNLSSHVAIHTGERNYKCEICTKTFTAKNSLSTHMRIHTGERNYKCETCTKRFITNGDLLKHMNMHTGEKNFKCEICTKGFGRKENLSNHMKLHTGERNYKCDICTKCFKIKENLSNHLKMHAGERNFTCDVCKKRFITKQHLSKHLKIHTQKRNVFLKHKNARIEHNREEESLRKIPYYLHCIGVDESRLIKEEAAVFIKKELDIDNDTIQSHQMAANNGHINIAIMDEKPIPTETFDLWQTFSSEIIIKEEHLATT